MAAKTTLQIGEPVLRQTAQAITDGNSSELSELINNLKDTMQAENLVGLAAPQLGVSNRVFVSEVRAGNWRKLPPEPFTVYINPEIVSVSHETDLDYEGCGSIASGQLFGKVERAKEITIKYVNEAGDSRETTATGLLARIIQHEIDHLNGVLFTDKVDPISLVSRDFYITNIQR